MQGNTLKPSRTVVTSFNPRKVPLAASVNSNDANSLYEEGDWVLCLTSSEDTLACALSSGEIQVYDKERLHVKQTFPRTLLSSLGGGVDATITSLVYVPQQPILVSTDRSGTLNVMDLRQHQQASSAACSAKLPTPALAVALGYEQGQLAAVGSVRGRIHFTDLRQPGNLLGTYVDSHTDDVTQVSFSPARRTVLLSAADDGLVCLYDTTQATEELARQAVCNVGTAVRHAGFCGNHGELVYCLTGSETMSLWRADTATAVCDYGWDTRARLSQVAGGGINVDYVVDACWNERTQQLNVMAGTAAGDAILYSWGGSDASLRADYLLQGGHRGVIRAWTPLEPGFSTLMTAGEDARLCEWRPTPTFCPAPQRSTAKRTSAAASGGGGGPMRRQRSKTSTSPY